MLICEERPQKYKKKRNKIRHINEKYIDNSNIECKYCIKKVKRLKEHYRICVGKKMIKQT